MTYYDPYAHADGSRECRPASLENLEAKPEYDHFENWDRPPQRKVGALADCQGECEPGECVAEGAHQAALAAKIAAAERAAEKAMAEAIGTLTAPAWVGDGRCYDPRPSLPEDDAKRALYPMAEGCLDYFPNALAEVSRISFEGNQKHNPGQPMHWARGKSTDHRNKIIRHTVDSVPETEAAIEHAAQAAWRALAYLQEKIERVRGVPMSVASRPA